MKSWKKINAGLRFMTGKHKAMQDKQKQRYMYIVKPESDIAKPESDNGGGAKINVSAV